MENAAPNRSVQLHHRLPRYSCFETRAGELILRDFCTPSLIESLRIDSGMRAFAHTPAREYQLLLRLAQRSDSVLTLAYTPAGEIVGELTLAPADSWWGENTDVYEIGLEVSSGWRQLGIARQLLNFTFALDVVEDVILLAIGLSWHWDTQGTGYILSVTVPCLHVY
jgi:GNAT superfamily N-acetyltransferase